MPRRTAYTRVVKRNQVRPPHVKGQSDVPYVGFQCLGSGCTRFLVVPREAREGAFAIACPDCGFVHASGGRTRVYDYDLLKIGPPQERLGSGSFEIPHEDYLAEAGEYKYCIVCNALKPFSAFDRHKARPRTGRQSECNLCKRLYNQIKNPTRLRDQHREAAEKRRLMVRVSGAAGRIDEARVRERFGHRCFRCDRDLRDAPDKEAHLDHTLPVRYLWPLATDTATLLCDACNGKKADKWPSRFYKSKEQLRRLSALTGLDVRILEGTPSYNPDALRRLRDPVFVADLVARFSRQRDELVRLRNHLLADEGFDMFAGVPSLSPEWIRVADEARQVRRPPKPPRTT